MGAPPPVDLLCLIGGHVQGHALWARGQRRLRADPLHRVDQVNATLALPVVAGLLERNISPLDLAKTRHIHLVHFGVVGLYLGSPGGRPRGAAQTTPAPPPEGQKQTLVNAHSEKGTTRGKRIGQMEAIIKLKK